MSHNNEILQNLWNLPIRDSQFGSDMTISSAHCSSIYTIGLYSLKFHRCDRIENQVILEKNPKHIHMHTHNHAYSWP